MSPTMSLFDVGSSRISIFIWWKEQVHLNSVLMRLIDDLLALDSIVHFNLSEQRLEQTATFSILTISEILEANPLLILIILKTFECLWLHTLHAKPRENEFESFSGQCLSEYIRQLILCPHEIQLNHSLFHLFSDEMMSDVDVFRPGVLDVVAAESYGTLVVTIQRDVIVCKAIIR
ncbi:hypothetical protein Tco_1019274 [Tanacetum coccineum]|uniref:Uncharacterized protein n=1 Tax=Tanacetum coccineum TaxID=301880 RepID=A0ABQ5FWZ3_9ASTR